MREEFEAKLSNNVRTQTHIQQKYASLQKRFDRLKEDLESERHKNADLVVEYDNKIKNHEEEVTLRLKLENKLNNLHSLHRDVESKYRRALKELSDQEISSAKMVDLMAKLKAELFTTKAENAKQEIHISAVENKLDASESRAENLAKTNEEYHLKIKDLEAKYLESGVLEMQIKEFEMKLKEAEARYKRLFQEKRETEILNEKLKRKLKECKL